MKKFKELWHNKRYHALMVLGLYLVFFIFVFIFISSMNDSKRYDKLLNDKVGLEYFAEIKNYTIYVIGDVNFKVDKEHIYYLDEVYTTSNMPLELQKYYFDFNPKLIYQMIAKATLESTNYLEKVDNYVLKKDGFFELTNHDIDNDVVIKVYKEEKIKKVELLLDEYRVIVEE